jgi:hypothetical protein
LDEIRRFFERERNDFLKKEREEGKRRDQKLGVTYIHPLDLFFDFNYIYIYIYDFISFMRE